jgi:hypothetical protein
MMRNHMTKSWAQILSSLRSCSLGSTQKEVTKSIVGRKCSGDLYRASHIELESYLGICKVEKGKMGDPGRSGVPRSWNCPPWAMDIVHILNCGKCFTIPWGHWCCLETFSLFTTDQKLS